MREKERGGGEAGKEGAVLQLEVKLASFLSLNQVERVDTFVHNKL